jgi:flagellar brake protein
MAFVETRPAPINHNNPGTDWQRFRVRSATQVLDELRALCRQDIPLVVGTPGGATVQALLWSVDDVQRRLHFRVEADPQALSGFSFENDLWAAAYVMDDKLQFALKRLSVSVGQGLQVMTADFPGSLYRLPRRRSLRVRRDDAHGPRIRFFHPADAQTQVCLLMLDVSSTGCALLNPAGGASLTPGLTLPQVEVNLNEEITIFSDLVVQHLSPHLSPDQRQDSGARVGCSWLGMPDSGKRQLRAWIQGGRRRRDLMLLSFD